MDRDGQALWREFCAAPSEVSFQALYDHFRSLVWTLCWRILGKEEDARDAFQSAWTRLFAHARDEGARAADEPIVPLIYRFSIREADALKKRKVRRGRREIVMDELPVVASNAVPADELAAAAERRTRLETIVALLPDKYRLPIQLHYLHGLTQVQIAEMMKIPRATVAARLARGVRKLLPLAERAGLDNVAGVLAAAAAGGVLLAPPKALAGAAVYLQIQTALAAVGAGAAVAGVSAAGAKTFFGLTAIKAKLALVSSVLILAAATVIGIQHANKTRAMRRPVVTVQRAAEIPVAQPTVDAGPVRAIENPVTIAPPTAPEATPAPTPIGPLRSVRVAVIWADTQRGAHDSTVSLQLSSADLEAIPISTRTDARGMATIAVPEAWGHSRLRAQNTDGLPASREIDPARVQQPIVITLARGGRVYGSVRMSDGTPAAGAQIAALSLTAARRTITGPDGSYEITQLPAGTAKLTAILQNLRSDMREPNGRPTIIAAGKRTGPVDLTLEPGLTVTGIVTAAKTGRPIAGASVKAQAGPRGVSDAAGRYVVYGLPPSRVALVARAESFGGKARMVAPTSGAAMRCDFALDPGGEVAVRVIDPAGSPVEKARVVSFYSRTYQLGDMDEQLETDASGRITLRNLATDQGLYLSAAKPGVGHASKNINFAAGELKTSATLTLKETEPRTGYIAGTVTDESGKPLAGINVFHGFFDAASGSTAQAVTGADGRYLIESEGSFAHTLIAYGKGRGTEGKASVQPGTKDHPARVDFTLKPGHWVAALVVDENEKPLKDLQIVLAPISGSQLPNAVATTDASGRFRADDLPEGRINVQISGRGIPFHFESIRVDQETRIVIKPAGTIRGRVVDKNTDKPLEAFTVRVAGGYLDPSFRAAGQAFSGNDGTFEITDLKKDETYTLLVESKGYTGHVEKRVVARGAGSGTELTIELSEGLLMRGVLLDAGSNRPIAGATVFYGMLPGAGEHVFWNQLADGGHSGNVQTTARAITGVDGRFEFNVEDEHQVLWIMTRAHKRTMLTEADRRKYLREGEFVIPLSAGARLGGRVLLDGKPQPNAEIRLGMIQGQNGATIEFGPIRSDGRGVYAVDHLETGRYVLSGPNRQMGSFGYFVYRRKIDVKEDAQNEFDLGGNLGGSMLSGAVLNNGSPAPNCIIRLTPMFEWVYESISGNSDQAGIFAIDGLQPGKYRASVVQYDRGGPKTLADEVVVEVGASATTHHFEKTDPVTP